MKKLLGIALMAALLSATSVYADGHGKKMAAVEAEIAKANAALDKAKKLGYEWRDARWKKSKFVKCGDKKMSILAAAECEAKAGNYDKALKHAQFATFQGEAGVKQAMAQKNAGPTF